jgi:hypothetical protein
MNPSRHSWLLGQSHPAIRLILIAIGAELEYRSVSRPHFGWGPKREPNAPIIAESEMTDLLRLLKPIWLTNMSMLAIGVELEYRSISRSLSGSGPIGEPNAPIATESEVKDFLRLLKLILRSDSSMLAITAGSEVTDFLRWRHSFCYFLTCYKMLEF